MSRSCTCYECVPDRIARRVFRHTKGGAEELPHRSKKDTKRWCKGKVGREHEFVRLNLQWYSIDACKNCGRYGRYYFYF